MRRLSLLVAVSLSFAGCQADPCAGSPCEHGAACLADGQGFACLCPEGYSGPTCAQDVDDCAARPCFNGGTCVDGVASFSCTCPAGFAGHQCETNVDDCSAAPCANGGVCVDRVDGYQCFCAKGFEGATCAQNVDDCSPNPCFNGGSCLDGLSSFSCTCPSGYWGLQCETAAGPLAVVAPPLPAAVVGAVWSAQLARTGGTSHLAWSIVPGGTRAAWLTLDPQSGLLSGTPPASALGTTQLTVQVQDTRYAQNVAQLELSVPVLTFAESFEGPCPGAWTLTGDWQCGAPTNVGPAATSGSQCLGTQLSGPYSNLQHWASTTATGPDLQLAPGVPQRLSFRAWVDTEGGTFDGFNLQLSTDSGATYTVVTGTPAYSLTIGGLSAWGGHQAAQGWQLFTADLSAWSGQTIRLRFAFQSDASGTAPGVYLDDLKVGP